MYVLPNIIRAGPGHMSVKHSPITSKTFEENYIEIAFQICKKIYIYIETLTKLSGPEYYSFNNLFVWFTVQQCLGFLQSQCSYRTTQEGTVFRSYCRYYKDDYTIKEV